MNRRFLFPEKIRILSGSMLKLIAMAAMIIDHTAGAFFKEPSVVLLSVAGHNLTLYLLMKIIGRLAFPIFMMLLIEGFLHTHSRLKYGIRLFVFALISEIPWNLEHTGTLFYSQQNVFFTLFFGFIGLCVMERFKDKFVLQAVILFALILLAYFFKADYGCTGFALILLFYVLREHALIRDIIGLGIIPMQLLCTHAFLAIEFYNGKRGFIKHKPVQLMFYAIYPVHMLVLWYINTYT